VMLLIDADYFTGNITKYLSLYLFKNGQQDIRKALHYSYKLHEVGGLPWHIRMYRHILYFWHYRTIQEWLSQQAHREARMAIHHAILGRTAHSISWIVELVQYEDEAGEPDGRYTNQD
jgi:hypothetical protein